MTDPGKILAYEGVARGDLAMLERAIRSRWPLPDEAKAGIVARVRELLESDDERIAARAASVLVAIEGQNQADQHLLLKMQRADEGKPDAVNEVRVIRVEFDKSG